VTFTDLIVDIAVTATPPDQAVDSAQSQLEQILATLRHDAVAIDDAHPAGGPSAMNRAWRTVFATAPIAEGWRWHAIGATVAALQDVSARDTASPAAVKAFATGTVIADRIAAVLESTTAADRWSHRTVAGLVGAGVAAGLLLNLDEAQLRNTVGLCATQAAGLRAVDESATAVVQVAKVAADAVEAAVLARHGFTSAADSMSGRRGLFALLSPDAAPQGDIGVA
jgi:hypothetical protein